MWDKQPKGSARRAQARIRRESLRRAFPESGPKSPHKTQKNRRSKMPFRVCKVLLQLLRDFSYRVFENREDWRIRN